jgi:hypothetical protein
MRRASKRVAAVVVVLLAVLGAGCAAFPQPKTESLHELPGTYYVNGEDPQGVEYGGRLEITQGDAPDTYEMQWIITGSLQTGTAVRDGDRLTAEWATVEGSTPADGPSTGTAEYTIESDGTLRGTRTVDGVDEQGTEEAFPVAE